ncbi:protein of unknown function [Paraburkholderia kururiensis]
MFHRRGTDAATLDERLSLVSWQESGSDHIRIKFVDCPLADRNKTIQQILEDDVHISTQDGNWTWTVPIGDLSPITQLNCFCT